MNLVATFYVSCSLCDAATTFVISDGRQTKRNELRKLGWGLMHIYAGVSHEVCPNHTLEERRDFAHRILAQRKTKSSRPKPKPAK